MNPFQFNQNPKERSCGWRCLYYLIPEDIKFSEFLERFKYFCPGKHGISFSNILAVLDYYKIECLFTVPSDVGTYIIWSAAGKDGKEWAFEGGHFFIYQDGVLFDSIKSEPYRIECSKLAKLLETKQIKKSFNCLKVEKNHAVFDK